MSARGAQQCDQGKYNRKDNYNSCSSCQFGTTTAGVGKGFTLADCSIAQGYGFHNGAIALCPIGKHEGGMGPAQGVGWEEGGFLHCGVFANLSRHMPRLCQGRKHVLLALFPLTQCIRCCLGRRYCSSSPSCC